jgi:hypothetical protein
VHMCDDMSVVAALLERSSSLRSRYVIRIYCHSFGFHGLSWVVLALFGVVDFRRGCG